VNILRGKLSSLQYGDAPYLVGERENRRPDLDELVDSVSNILERHGHAVRIFDNAAKTLPGLAFARLEFFAANLSPAPVDPGASRAERLNNVVSYWWTAEYAVHQALSGGPADDYAQRRFATIVGDLKAQAKLLHTDLLSRLSRKELRRERQWWRHAGRWITTKVGEALVQTVVALLLGIVIGYIIGR
jgi:hypothetical protein